MIILFKIILHYLCKNFEINDGVLRFIVSGLDYTDLSIQDMLGNTALHYLCIN